jgi:hypothetical protein
MMSCARLLIVASLLVGLSCREPNPAWDPNRQAVTATNADEGEDESDDTSTLPECEDHETLCGDQCVDLLSTPAHCGECFAECRAPEKECEQGECVR